MNSVTEAMPAADLLQFAFSCGLQHFSRHSEVRREDGSTVTVADLLVEIRCSLDAFMRDQCGSMDPVTLACSDWSERRGWKLGPRKEFQALCAERGASFDGIEAQGLLLVERERVRLKKPSELPLPAAPWDCTWKCCHHLIAALESGERNVAIMALLYGSAVCELAMRLAYRLYYLHEARGRGGEGTSYHLLTDAWPGVRERIKFMLDKAQAESLPNVVRAALEGTT